MIYIKSPKNNLMNIKAEDDLSSDSSEKKKKNNDNDSEDERYNR